MSGVSLFAPPLALPIMLAAALLISFGLSRLAPSRRTNQDSAGEAYACGEHVPDHMIQPDYGQFLPFAFSFTILHVIALMATTVPGVNFESFTIAGIYLLCATVLLLVLYRS
jgi:hypothetical protein